MNVFIKFVVVISVLLSVEVIRLSARELVAPEAPFAYNSQVTTAAKSVFSADGVSCGTKQLVWSDGYDCMKLLNNDQMIFSTRIRVKPSFPGWAPFDKYITTVDETRQQVTRQHNFRLTADASGSFNQTIHLCDNGKVEIVNHYLVGDQLSLLKDQLYVLYFPLPMIQSKKLQLTTKGDQITDLVLPDKANWDAGTGTDDYWIHSGWFPQLSKVVFAPDSPGESFTLEFPDAEQKIKHAIIFRGKEGAFLYLTFAKPGDEFSMTVDFGKCNEISQQDNIVNGINFTRNNGYEVSVFDQKRNMFVNPSFEAGVRYFHDRNSGRDIRHLLSTDQARSGKYSLRLDGATRSFPFPTIANRDYTFSFYAKTLSDQPNLMYVELDNYYLRSETLRREIQVKGTDWTRYHVTFNWPHRAVAIRFGGKNIWIDDLQFEESATVSSYYGNTMGIELLSDCPDTYFANIDQPINARLLLRGPSGTRGVIAAQIEDFFRTESLRKSFDFVIPDSGETILTLAPDSCFVRGINRIRLQVQPEGLPDFVDFMRISVFPYADNSAKNRGFHAIHRVGWPHNQAIVPDSVFNLLKYCGISTFTYGNLVTSYTGPFTPELSKTTFDRYQQFGFETWTSLTNRIAAIPQLEGKGVYGINGHGLTWEGRNIFNMEEFPEEFLRQVEEYSYETGKKYPWVTKWNTWTEPGTSFLAVRNDKYEEYAKFVLAMYRGLKRANPDNLFSPFGACTMSEIGRREVIKFLAAAKKVAPEVSFETIDIHPYRRFPELPDTEDDLLALIDSLDKIGYDKIAIRFMEGAYFYPLIVQQWQGIAPWADTLGKDGYTKMHVPSFDLGWGEKVAAAMLLRHWLVAYKHQDRLKMACTWGSYYVDTQNPFASLVMSATLTDLLGNATFRQDIRFAPDARALLFDDDKERTVAAIWRFEEEMDRGFKSGNDLLVTADFAAEYIDMMGNHCTVSAEQVASDWVKVLPLSNFPIFLRVATKDAALLTQAIASSQVRGENRSPLQLSARLATTEKLVLTAVNPLSRTVTTSLSLNNMLAQTVKFTPGQSKTFDIVLPEPLPEHHFSDISIPVTTEFNNSRQQINFDLNALPIRKVADNFNWNDIPAVPIEHVQMEFDAKQTGTTWSGADDLSAVGRFAWNESGLYIRLEVTDDKFVLNHDRPDPKFWYDNDGVQLFFDSFANGRENAMGGQIGFDDDDYSYELLPTDSNNCLVYRRHVPDHQFTGGVEDGLRGNMVEPALHCEFTQVGNKLTYTIVFPARYLMPAIFETGRSLGLGIKIYDRDQMQGTAKQTLGNIPESKGNAFERPDLYSQLLFVK